MELPHVGMPNAGEECEAEPGDEGMLLAALFVAIVVVIAAVVLGYFVPGACLAALLPGITDHQPRERRLFGPQRRTVWEWFDDNKDAVAGYTILGFVVLWAAGVIR